MNTITEPSIRATAEADLFPSRAGTWVMGVLNCTPDSFSDGGLFDRPAAAIEHALRMIEDGADILDIGGESTRPGSEPVAPREQIRRTVPVIRAVREQWSGPISIDTTRSEVAAEALAAGATWINDVSALENDPVLADLAKDSDAAIILMHMRGTPLSMQDAPAYDDVVVEVSAYLRDRASLAESRGISHDRIIIDPGIGFGKTVEHNLQLLKSLHRLADLGYPVLVGASRKSFIGHLTGSVAGDRLEGSIAAAMWASLHGARMVRVHDVKATRRALTVAEAIASSS